MSGTPSSATPPAAHVDDLAQLGSELHALADGIGQQLQTTRYAGTRAMGVFGVLFGLLAIGTLRVYISVGPTMPSPPPTLFAGLFDIILGVPLLAIGMAYLLFPRKVLQLQSRVRARFRPTVAPPEERTTISALLDRLAWTHRELETLSDLTFGVGVFLVIIGSIAGILSGTLIGAVVAYGVGGAVGAFFRGGGVLLFPLAGFAGGVIIGSLRYLGIKSLDARLHRIEMRLGGLSYELWQRF